MKSIISGYLFGAWWTCLTRNQSSGGIRTMDHSTKWNLDSTRVDFWRSGEKVKEICWEEKNEWQRFLHSRGIVSFFSPSLKSRKLKRFSIEEVWSIFTAAEKNTKVWLSGQKIVWRKIFRERKELGLAAAVLYNFASGDVAAFNNIKLVALSQSGKRML